MTYRIWNNRSVAAIGCALLILIAGRPSNGQAPAGFDLLLVDMNGSRTVVGRLPPSTFAPRISPDGQRIAFETRDRVGADGARLWVADLSNLASRRALSTTAGPVNWAPIWKLEGQRIVFIVSGDGPDRIFSRRADGTGEAEHLIDARSAEGWIAGGSHLRFLTLTGNRDYGISLLDMKTRTASPLIDLPGSAQHSSAMSPDGRWIAYASNETGRYEVWMEPFPRTGTRHRITSNGGSHPVWSSEGESLYLDRDQQLFQVRLNRENPSASGAPVPLPIKGFVQGEYRRQFDLMPNGRAFLVLMSVATH